jgi:hypothetical protein
MPNIEAAEPASAKWHCRIRARLYPFVRKKGTIVASPPQRADDANPTNHDATLAEPVRATILERRLASRAGATGRSFSAAPGKRTVGAALRVMGLGQPEHSQRCHRLLNRAAWSGRKASRVLLSLLLALVRKELWCGAVTTSQPAGVRPSFSNSLASGEWFMDDSRSAFERTSSAANARLRCRSGIY